MIDAVMMFLAGTCLGLIMGYSIANRYIIHLKKDIKILKDKLYELSQLRLY